MSHKLADTMKKAFATDERKDSLFSPHARTGSKGMDVCVCVRCVCVYVCVCV